jgi:predicted membrane protein
MKMSTSLFWGILLILIGLSLILKIVFNVEFSVFRVVIAFLLIYLGIRLFIGKDFSLFPKFSKDTETVFSEKTIHHVDNNKEYHVIFGSGKFDLRDLPLPDSGSIHIKLNTVFGGSQVTLNPGTPVQINSNTVFGGTKMPDGNTSAFGSLDYTSDSAKKAKPKLYIETNTVFGGTLIKTNDKSGW